METEPFPTQSSCTTNNDTKAVGVREHLTYKREVDVAIDRSVQPWHNLLCSALLCSVCLDMQLATNQLDTGTYNTLPLCLYV